jgi:hypothetical protein
MRDGIGFTQTRKDKSSFNIYVDLFNKGEFNEIVVIPQNRNFSVLLDDMKLATIAKDKGNSWIKVEGSMPREKLEQIGNMINLRLGK